MLLIAGLWVYLAILSTLVNGEDLCYLHPSELGPDWYKVARPVPPDFEDIMEPSFIHMPCAATTVFDVGICGCTNLMSFIHTSYKDKGPRGNSDTSSVLQNLRDSDQVKWRDPADSMITPAAPVGSRILNTRTGEMTDCPFRASSRGKSWYLMREPTETWRPMKCAEGTLFEKRACTCVHESVASREPQKPDDVDLVVLEEVYEEAEQSNKQKISKSLGISISDVDFSSRPNSDTPFWRRNTDDHHTPVIHYASPTADVQVTLDSTVLTPDQNTFVKRAKFISAVPDVSHGEFSIGRDSISEEHRQLLQKLRAGPVPYHRQAALMFIDTAEQLNSQQTNNSLVFKPVLDTVPHGGELVQNIVDVKPVSQNNDDTSNDDKKSHIPNLEDAHVISEKDEQMSKIQGLLNILNDNIMKDEVYLKASECSKRPLPDLGAQYFLLYIFEAGYVPFTCHGSRIYDDRLCACVQAPDHTFVDEVNLPKVKCNKRAIPELGPEYFERHLWGVGAVPYACHGGKNFSEQQCDCVL